MCPYYFLLVIGCHNKLYQHLNVLICVYRSRSLSVCTVPGACTLYSMLASLKCRSLSTTLNRQSLFRCCRIQHSTVDTLCPGPQLPSVVRSIPTFTLPLIFTTSNFLTGTHKISPLEFSLVIFHRHLLLFLVTI